MSQHRSYPDPFSDITADELEQEGGVLGLRQVRLDTFGRLDVPASEPVVSLYALHAEDDELRAEREADDDGFAAALMVESIERDNTLGSLANAVPYVEVEEYDQEALVAQLEVFEPPAEPGHIFAGEIIKDQSTAPDGEPWHIALLDVHRPDFPKQVVEKYGREYIREALGEDYFDDEAREKHVHALVDAELMLDEVQRECGLGIFELPLGSGQKPTHVTATIPGYVFRSYLADEDQINPLPQLPPPLPGSPPPSSSLRLPTQREAFPDGFYAERCWTSYIVGLSAEELAALRDHVTFEPDEVVDAVLALVGPTAIERIATQIAEESSEPAELDERDKAIAAILSKHPLLVHSRRPRGFDRWRAEELLLLLSTFAREADPEKIRDALRSLADDDEAWNQLVDEAVQAGN